MTNADLFRAVFNGLMATELWAKPESEFLEWLNAEAITNEEPLTGQRKTGMILIDMPMPENCSECRFVTECGYCKAMPDNFCGYTDDAERPKWCPLKASVSKTNRRMQIIEPQMKKEIRDQIEHIREFLEEHQEDWYVYETLRDELRQLEIMLEREQVI